MDAFQPGDRVGVWEPLSGRVFFEEPLARQSLPCESFLEFSSRSFVMQLSDEHRVPHWDWAGRFQVLPALTLALHPSKRTIPTTFSIPQPGLAMSDAEIRLRIALCADGFLPKIGRQAVFNLRRPRKLTRLRALLEQAGIPYREKVCRTRPTEHVFTIRRDDLTKDMRFVWSLSPAQLAVVLEECLEWDGCRANGEWKFCSTRRDFVDAIQFAAHATGFRATIFPVIPKNPRHAVCYNVHIRTADNPKNRAMVRCDTTRIRRIPSPDGRKYCFTTSTGFFVARCRDSIFITGNSGKSVACTMEVFSRALEAPPFEGVRRSRWAFVRSSYPELISTTMKTWSDWVPTQLCPITFGTVISGRMIAPLADNTKVDLEIIFLSMDREEDVRKMKSLELTGVWFNEAGELLKSSVEAGISRTGRFPGKLDGGAGRWFGAIADTNPPSDDSWWYEWAEVTKPQGYEFFSQPPAVIRLPPKKPGDPPQYVPNDGTHGLSPAENVEWQNLGFDYWLRMVPGRDEEWIKVFLQGQYGTVLDGKPVYGNLFNDALHTAPEPLTPIRGLPLLLGWDYGLNASCVFVQFTPKGEMLVLDEVTTDGGIQQCVREKVRPLLNGKYAGMRVFSVGDPAGQARTQTTEQTCMQLLAEEGIPTESAPTNEFVARREAVTWFLTRMVEGKPVFRLSPTCEMIRKGFLGRYQYRRMHIAGSSRYTDKPEKNDYSHLHDALQYAALYLRTVKMDGAAGHLGRARRAVKYNRPQGWA